MADTKISALPASTTPLAGTEVLPIVQSSATKQVSISNVTAGRTVAMRNAVLTGATAYQDIGAAGDTTYHYSRIIDNGGTGFYFGIDSSVGGFFGAGAYGRVLYSEGAYPLSVYINASKKVEFTTAGNIAITNSGNGIDFAATAGAGTSELLADYEEGTWTPGQGSGVTVVGTYSSSGRYTKIGRLVTIQFVVAGSTSIAVNSGANFITGLPFAGSSGVYFIGSALNGAATFSSNPIVLDSIIYSAETITATTSIYGTMTYMV